MFPFDFVTFFFRARRGLELTSPTTRLPRLPPLPPLPARLLPPGTGRSCPPRRSSSARYVLYRPFIIVRLYRCVYPRRRRIAIYRHEIIIIKCGAWFSLGYDRRLLCF